MKLNNKIISVLVLLLATITVMTSEVLSQRRFKPHKRPGLILEMLADELELTEEQLTEIKEQRVATEKSSIELRSNIQIAELELRELLRQDNPDENQIISKIEEIGKLKTELRLTRVQGRLAIKKVLTSEQLEKLKAIRKERMKNRQQKGRPFRDRKPFRGFQGNQGDFQLQGFDFVPDEPYNEWADI